MARCPAVAGLLSESSLHELIESRPVVRASDDAFALDQNEVVVVACIEQDHVPVMYERWREQLAAIMREADDKAEFEAYFGQACWPTEGVDGESLLATARDNLQKQ
jgi:hypothetical protein